MTRVKAGDVKVRQVHSTKGHTYARVPTAWLGVPSGGLVEIVFRDNAIVVRRHQALDKNDAEKGQP